MKIMKFSLVREKKQIALKFLRERKSNRTARLLYDSICRNREYILFLYSHTKQEIPAILNKWLVEKKII